MAETTKEQEERKKREEQQKRDAQQKATQNQTPTSTPGKPATKPLAYTPGQRQETQTGDPRGDTSLSWDEIHALAGDLEPGMVGWLELDEEGNPTGTATRKLPPPGDHKMWARVVGSPQRKYDDIVTPSGAPVTKYMNPDPVLWDEGMLARNPIPPEELEKDAGQPGVINKPGTV